MILEDKELLFKDFCARLPYGTIVCDKNNPTSVGKLVSLDVQNKFATFEVDEQTGELYTCPTEFVIPYLRPMSSMTKDERKEYMCLSDLITVDGVLVSSYETFDWLIKNHFDFRGLIPKGLALEAPEGMYK